MAKAWYFLGEARRLPPAREVYLTLMRDAGWLRQASAPTSSASCNGLQRCPQTGIWEGRVANDHPLAVLYNRWDQQAFVEEGKPFPGPGARFLDIAPQEVRWTYRGSPNAQTASPGIYSIDL